MKKSFAAILVAGLVVAYIDVGGIGDLADVIEEGSWTADLIVPLSIMAAAFLVKFVAGWLALVAAWTLTGWVKAERSDARSWPGRIWRRWVDRLNLARGYRALRWTSQIRQRARERLEPKGRVLAAYAKTMTWATVVGVVALVVLFVFLR